MQLVLDYELYPEDFWKVNQTNWETATLSDFDTLNFYGDLVFRYGEAVFDYRNTPILGFAYEFTEAFLKVLEGHESTVYYCFLEGDDELILRPVCEGRILIQASYTHKVATVPVDLLCSTITRFNNRLVDELTQHFPFLRHHPLFQQIANVLSLE